MSHFDAYGEKFWFVRAVGRLGVGWLGGAVLMALAPYLLALLVVTPFGDAGLYLRTPAFYFGFFGAGLAVVGSYRGVQILTRGLAELEEVAIDPAKFRSYCNEQLTEAARFRPNLGMLASFAAGAVALVVAALHRWHSSGVVPAGHHFRAFLVEWRAPDALLPAGLALAVFAIAVVIRMGGSIVLLLRNLRFAWHLRTFDYMPFPGRVRLGVPYARSELRLGVSHMVGWRAAIRLVLLRSMVRAQCRADSGRRNFGRANTGSAVLQLPQDPRRNARSDVRAPSPQG